ncbi:MAG: aminopeptidase P family protein [Actinomycetota bacterium]|nr:aminopeptidase P family protein [Actinomycetota bacterium]
MAESRTAPATDAAHVGLELDVQLERRRQAAAEEWSLDDQLVLVGAGTPIPVPGRGDIMYPFRVHSEYLYLTDRERAGGVLAFDPADGWFDFVAPVTREERLWEGATEDDNDGLPFSELESWLAGRKERSIACLGVPVPEVTSLADLEVELRYALNRVRRQKDAVELDRMRAAERATAAGFARIASVLEPGRTEREVQIDLEAAFFRNGADFLAFETIVGGGPNSAVLHFPATHRPFADGDVVLVDAGAEYRGYACDVTRTYPASAEFTPEQQAVYAIVKAASGAATDRCAPGTEWRDVHRAASLVIAEGLVELGLLRGDHESLVERGAQAVFFPHGVGHLVGLGVRDAGEVLPGREPPEGEFPRLRVDLPLAPGYVVTVEPGIYFVPALVHDADFRERYGAAVDWERAEAMLGFGGIRIENDVLITEHDHEVLTDDIALFA